MRTVIDPRIEAADVLPKVVDRFLRGLAQLDEFADTRSTISKLFGVSHFSWQTGWMNFGTGRLTFVQVSAWPPKLLTQTHDRLSRQFVIVRVERGLLDRRRQHPFMVVLISGRRDLGV